MAKNILLVEDDLDIQAIYSSKLGFEGYNVMLAIDTQQALDRLQDKSPSLILLDIMLPGKMNGFEFLEHLKKDSKYKNIPIIVITNLDTERKQALEVGADDYLIKADTDINLLVDKVKKYAK